MDPQEATERLKEKLRIAGATKEHADRKAREAAEKHDRRQQNKR